MGTLTAGIKEIFSSAKTTGSNVMLCGNDGTPDGHITMSNLANVLGDILGITHFSGTGSATINKGYGVVFAWNVSLGDYSLCTVGGGNDVYVVRKIGDGITVTKPSEYQTKVTLSNSNRTIDAIMIAIA